MLLNGRGTTATARLVTAGGRQVEVEVEAVTRHRAPSPVLVLAQSLPKQKAAAALLRHATEIGVRVLQPLTSEHGEVQLKGGRAGDKASRLAAGAAEACKQSGNPFLPEIREVTGLTDWLATLPAADAGELRLVASLRPGAAALPAIARAGGEPPGRVLWLVGPEGDFSGREYALAEDAGFRHVRLGPWVLRSETAALYALAAGQQLFAPGAGSEKKPA